MKANCFTRPVESAALKLNGESHTREQAHIRFIRQAPRPKLPDVTDKPQLPTLTITAFASAMAAVYRCWSIQGIADSQAVLAVEVCQVPVLAEGTRPFEIHPDPARRGA